MAAGRQRHRCVSVICVDTVVTRCSRDKNTEVTLIRMHSIQFRSIKVQSVVHDLYQFTDKERGQNCLLLKNCPPITMAACSQRRE